MKKILSSPDRTEILKTLKERFEKNRNRHPEMDWSEIQKKLENKPESLWSLNEMEQTGGEPDVVDFNAQTGEYIFIDCSIESPSGRRSFCYDRKAWEARKANKPANNAIDIANEMGISILSEDQYRRYHPLVGFEKNTSSWVLTPDEVRVLGGAIFCDFRFDRVFTYHNGADSYYAARGFRGFLVV